MGIELLSSRPSFDFAKEERKKKRDNVERDEGKREKKMSLGHDKKPNFEMPNFFWLFGFLAFWLFGFLAFFTLNLKFDLKT